MDNLGDTPSLGNLHLVEDAENSMLDYYGFSNDMNFITLWCHQTGQWKIPYKSHKWRRWSENHLYMGDVPLPCLIAGICRGLVHPVVNQPSGYLLLNHIKPLGCNDMIWVHGANRMDHTRSLFPFLSLWPAWCFPPCVSSSPATKLNTFQYHFDTVIKACQTTRYSLGCVSSISEDFPSAQVLHAENSWTLPALSSAFSTSISSLGSQLILTVLQDMLESGLILCHSTGDFNHSSRHKWLHLCRIILSC